MRILAVVVAVFMSGCSWLPDRTLEYRQTEVMPRMVLPQGMVILSGEDMFPVPEAERRHAYNKRDRFEVPRPPESVIIAEQQPAPDAPRPDVASTRIVLTKDGNDYPIIMMYTAFPWAWEYVDQALVKTDLRVDDRSRDAGIFFVRVPKSYGLSDREAQIKLSHTVNGVQVAVLNSRGSALVEPGPGLAILQRLRDNL